MFGSGFLIGFKISNFINTFRIKIIDIEKIVMETKPLEIEQQQSISIPSAPEEETLFNYNDYFLVKKKSLL